MGCRKAKDILPLQSKFPGSTVTANSSVPPCLGLVSATAGPPEVRAAMMAAVNKRNLACVAAERQNLTAGSWLICTVPFQGVKRDRSLCRDGLPDLAFLPELELPEKLVFLLLAHRLSAGGLLTLVDKLREDRLEIPEVWCGGYLHVAFQPILGGRKTPPAGKLGRDIDLVPFWMVAGLEQGLEPGKERLDKVHEVAVAVGAILKVGSREHGTDCHRVDRLVRRHQTRIILAGETCRDINGGNRRFERDGKKVEPILARQVTEERRRFPGDEGDGGNLALAELLERHLMIIVGGRHRDVQKIEKPTSRDRAAGTAQINIHLLVRQLCDTLDVVPSEQ